MNEAPAFLLSFAAMTAYVPGWAGAATSPRWIVVGVGSWLLLFFADRIVVTGAHVLGLVFVGWCVLTLAWSADIDSGVGALFQFVALAGAFALASTLTSLRPVFAGAATGLAVSSAIVIAQWCGWPSELLASYHLPAALFVNANYMGETAALVIVGCVGYRLWTGAIVSAPALLLSGARGAMLAVAIAGVAWCWSRWMVVARGAVIVVAILGVSALIAGHGGKSIDQRFAIWSDTARSITWTGYGLGAFWSAFPKQSTATDLSKDRPERAHNEVLDLAFETGLIGAFLLGLFALSMVGPLNAERFVLIAFAAIAMLAFPLHMPATAFLGTVCAGHLARRDERVRITSRIGGSRLRQGLEPECLDPGAVRRA